MDQVVDILKNKGMKFENETTDTPSEKYLEIVADIVYMVRVYTINQPSN
jgi:hypothetical protein